MIASFKERNRNGNFQFSDKSSNTIYFQFKIYKLCGKNQILSSVKEKNGNKIFFDKMLTSGFWLYICIYKYNDFMRYIFTCYSHLHLNLFLWIKKSTGKYIVRCINLQIIQTKIVDPILVIIYLVKQILSIFK